MKTYYSIAIPEPCHEDWNQMSPREKGKFCSSCSKTVIDFTKMNTVEIQDFIHQNKQKNICGHFKQIQLDSINLHVPSKVLEQNLNFHKLFLLALLITMGTTLFNCTNKNGNSQKIDSIEVIDTLNNNKVVNVLEGIPVIEKMDSILKPVCTSSKNEPSDNIVEEITLDGFIIKTVGDIDTNANKDESFTKHPDSIPVIEPPIVDIEGEIATVGIVIPEINPNEPIPIQIVKNPPEFKNTPRNLSITKKRDYLSKGISKIVRDNFNTSVCQDLTGKQKVFVQFQIDTLGNLQNVKARAPHPTLEKEAIRTVELLPNFIPATQNGKPVVVVYTLPIVFNIE